MAEKEEQFIYSKCPYCEKDNLVRDRNDKGWCNDSHKRNYEFNNRDDSKRYSA